MTTSIDHVTSKDGTRIGFQRSGSGPPLVLVHGASADHTRWAPVLPALEGRFTVYGVDRCGRGLSGDHKPYALEREYEDIAAVVESIGDPVDILGHSFGAFCVMEASLLTQHLRRVVLYEPVFPARAPVDEQGLLERLKAMLERGNREELLTTFFREAVGVSEPELEMLRAAPAWAGRVAAAHTILREGNTDYVFDPGRFEGLNAPVMLLTGSESPPAMRAATEPAHAALPNSSVTVMPGQAHVAMNTAPELFVRLVIEFLTE
jgi:pimeloyl-ACP methyl ester carboxylesterase